MRPQSLAVLGLGAIGGSVAWQARLNGVPRVIGYSPDPADGMLALKSAALTDLADSAARAVREADFVVLAAPPSATLDLIDRLGAWLKPGAWVTDVTSIKAPVVARAASVGLSSRFAGSHPLAGTHVTGFGGARSDLMRGAIVYVTPAGSEPEPVREIMDFWAGSMAAEPVQITATGHDEQLAWTSHLPQAAAYALAAVMARRKGVSFGTGARDTTRLAASSAPLWSELFQLNAAEILPALEELEREIGALRTMIGGAESEPLRRYLEDVRTFRRGLDR